MEKIRTYIKNGKGLGFLFLLASAVVMTIFVMFILKQTYSEMRPKVMLVADEILPITVSQGKITNPVDAYKRLDIQLGDNNEEADVFPVVLDTRNETAELPKVKMGLFIMRDVVYWVMEDQVKRYPLRDGEMTKPVLEEKLDAVLGMFSLFISVALILILFVFSLVEAVILAGFGGLFLKIYKADNLFSFDALMRLSAVVVAAIEIFGFILSLFGIPPVLWCQFVIALIGICLFLYREKAILR